MAIEALMTDETGKAIKDALASIQQAIQQQVPGGQVGGVSISVETDPETLTTLSQSVVYFLAPGTWTAFSPAVTVPEGKFGIAKYGTAWTVTVLGGGELASAIAAMTAADELTGDEALPMGSGESVTVQQLADFAEGVVGGNAAHATSETADQAKLASVGKVEEMIEDAEQGGGNFQFDTVIDSTNPSTTNVPTSKAVVDYVEEVIEDGIPTTEAVVDTTVPNTPSNEHVLSTKAVVNAVISAMISPKPGYKGTSSGVTSMTTIATFNLKAGAKYKLKVKSSSTTPSIAVYNNYIYKSDGSTSIMNAPIYANSDSGESMVYNCLEDLSGCIFKSEVRSDFQWELLVETDVSLITTEKIADSAITTDKIADANIKTNKIADKNVTISKIKDFTKDSLLDGFLTGSDKDYNPYIKECYIIDKYITSTGTVTIRSYNNGVIIRAYNSASNALWTMSNTTVFNNVQNGDIIPIVVTSIGIVVGGVEVGTTVGYIIFNDIAGFKAKQNDNGNGQKFSLGLCTKLFTQYNIYSYLNGNPVVIPDASITTLKIASKAVTLDKTKGVSLYEGVYISLPPVIHAVVGDKLQIFFRSVVHCANPALFDVIAICAKGKSYPRYWEYTPSSIDAGTSTNITIRVRDNSLQTIVEKTVTIQFTNTMSTPSANKNVLCIGASATANGVWVGELKRRLTEITGNGTPSDPTGLGLNNITFVGRKQGSSVDVPLEATGGWKVQTYASQGETAFRMQVSDVTELHIGDTYTASSGGGVFILQEINVTEGVGNLRFTFNSAVPTIPSSGTLTRTSGSGDSTITYTSYAQETFSPFWNNSLERLDFTTYANDWCDGSIDIMIWHCGVNDIFAGTNSAITSAINAFKNILRQYHTDFPSGKVIISSVPVCSLNGGMSANYGASDIYNILTFSNAARKYAIALSELCSDNEFSSFTKYAPVLEEFDAENCYPSTDVSVNNRLSATEKLGTNGVHPTTAGSYQVADGVYRTFNIL